MKNETILFLFINYFSYFLVFIQNFEQVLLKLWKKRTSFGDESFSSFVSSIFVFFDRLVDDEEVGVEDGHSSLKWTLFKKPNKKKGVKQDAKEEHDDSKILPIFEEGVSAYLKEIPNLYLLFRSDSLLSNLIQYYIRKEGRDYLDFLFAPFFAMIVMDGHVVDLKSSKKLRKKKSSHVLTKSLNSNILTFSDSTSTKGMYSSAPSLSELLF